ncbi:MAG TPA: 50S ribosomal protein L5 [Candidatus Paceibacterota bacterium]|uniref:Large ribosomal subunit protein uL5 n=1 Tax=uncultured Parcubacteria bacterium Rifle_16ft_4_minimus_2958 TaxID=1665137 RepID=A0A0H4T520_9BACT|nr:50S ribosomal protein L5, large subunit ribosomal protein L5 [uncultured Parcubacteria bacterium Rifle_16ft_4_minimus_2958]
MQNNMTAVKEKQNKAFELMKGKYGYKNIMAAPKILKVVLSVGTGSDIKKDKHRGELIADRLAKITGQKTTIRAAKKSIATFKLREGEPVGVMVTLRGTRMYAFLDKFLNVSLPRTKDFRGIDPKAVDNIGNITIGLKEHTIFPETADEELKDVFGLAITIVTSARSKAEATEFLRLIGVPFKK